MKIIRKGKLRVATFTGRCAFCGCEIECDESEVKFVDGDPREPGYQAARCPTPGCGREVGMRPKGK